MGVIKSRTEVDNNVMHINRTVISDDRGELEVISNKDCLVYTVSWMQIISLDLSTHNNNPSEIP